MEKNVYVIKKIFLILFTITFPLMTQQTPEKIIIKALAYGSKINKQGQTWMQIVEKFEKDNPNIDIQYELLLDEEYHQEVKNLLSAGGDSIPDIACMGVGSQWGEPWEKAGQRFDHRPYINADYYDLSLIPTMGPNGEIWEIPMGVSNIWTVLFMNEPLVKSLGFSYPKTYQDLVAMVPKAQAKDIEVVTINGKDGWAWSSCLLSCIIGRISGDPDWISNIIAGRKEFSNKEFVDSLKMIQKMVKDGVISANSLYTDYDENINKFSKNKALFMLQGQWAALRIKQPVQNQSLMLPLPALPGEKANMADSAAASISVGYGLTKKGGSNTQVRNAFLKFLQEYFYTESEINLHFKNGNIVAPVLKAYSVPNNFPPIIKQKLIFCHQVKIIKSIEEWLPSSTNDKINHRLQDIVKGKISPGEVAAEFERLLKK